MSHYDILMQKDGEIEQLRARVAVLEEALRGLLATSRALHRQTDEMGWSTVMTAENALQAAPQQGQEQEQEQEGEGRE